nr:hypothetical protein Itr_chr02CG13630 [Ipomoea trifida]
MNADRPPVRTQQLRCMQPQPTAECTTRLRFCLAGAGWKTSGEEVAAAATRKEKAELEPDDDGGVMIACRNLPVELVLTRVGKAE